MKQVLRVVVLLAGMTGLLSGCIVDDDYGHYPRRDHDRNERQYDRHAYGGDEHHHRGEDEDERGY